MSIANLFIMFIFCDRLMSQGHFLLRGFLRYAHEVVPFEKVFSIFVRIPEIERWFQIPSRLFSWTSFIFILFGLFTSVSVRKIYTLTLRSLVNMFHHYLRPRQG